MWGGIECGMTQSTKLTSTIMRAIAAHAIGWVIEDAATLPKAIREKLHVPLAALPSALASLAPLELLELKKIIVQLDSTRALPGPMNANELCEYLNLIGA